MEKESSLSGSSSYDRTFYEGQQDRSLSSARLILGKLFPVLGPRRVLDVGCGVGTWLRVAAELSAEEICGIDGSYVDRSMLHISPAYFHPAALDAERLEGVLARVGRSRFDLTICLEVAEHLPFERAPSLVEDLTASADVVLFSAAVPYQYGTDHINEQWPEFWATLFRARGFACYDFLREPFWNDPHVDWWYAQNVLVFAKQGSHAEQRLTAHAQPTTGPLSKIHPENFLVNLLTLFRQHRLSAFPEEEMDYRSVARTYLSGASVIPRLEAVARALANEREGNAGVFPLTRIAVGHPEQEIATLTENYLSEKELRETAQREAAEADRVARLATEEARVQAEKTKARLANSLALADQLSSEINQLNARCVALVEAERRLAAELAEARTAKASVESLLSKQLAESEVKYQGELDRVRQLTGELANVLRELQQVTESTAWKMTGPLRRLGTRMPASVRRLVRGSLKIFWWSLTLQLRKRLLERKQFLERQRLTVAASTDAANMAVVREEGAAPAAATDAAVSKYEKGNLRALSDATIDLMLERMRRFKLFNGEDYLRMRPDVMSAQFDPHLHAIAYGAWDHRPLFRRDHIARSLGQLEVLQAKAEDIDATLGEGSLPEVGVYVSSHGNVFMHEIADDLANDLRLAGATVSIRDESSSIDGRPPICVFIAPHEFFSLGEGKKWARDDVLAQSFMYTTEQLQTPWFNIALPYVLSARGVIDIVQQTARLFGDAAIPSLHFEPSALPQPSPLQPGDRRHPLFCTLPDAAKEMPIIDGPLCNRSIDVCFFGAETARRENFFARHAGFLADYNAFFSYRRASAPIIKGGDDAALTRIAAHVSGHAKVSLNLHREEFGYFEWHRIVRLAMSAGSIVVSEPCLPHPIYKPGEHYFEETGRHIPELIEWIVRSEEGGRRAEEMRARVFASLKTASDAREKGRRLITFLGRNAS